MREIYRTFAAGLARDRAIDALITYMNWRSGRATLERYDHYFRDIEHADLQNTLHATIDRTLRARKPNFDLPSSPIAPRSVPDIVADPHWQFLQHLGGANDELPP
ncbi:hypothetical protein AWB82_06241 [Caballeronia glebae]|uniref:Uncharacterized protein n=2 Tax=Caballeronia glebae TaxID=1777143 RepID=A0A158D4F1_9BURK|nr:hypothetical protein AWB82_06241 [Caballeronia glebae]